MNQALFTQLKKPALWQRSTEAFWDDEHISKGMLEAHLNPNWDAATRKKETVEASLRFLSQTFPSGGRLLDLGCGPGLYTGPLARMGYTVTGLDLSRRSIAYAQAHDSLTQYRVADYLTLDEPPVYDAVTLIYCDYAALTAPERRELLPRIYAALKPGGLFLLDVFTLNHAKNNQESQSWSLFPSGGFWSPLPHLLLNALYLYEGGTVSAEQSLILTENELHRHIIWDTCYSPESLMAELSAAGFTQRAVYSDVCGNPWREESDTLCLLVEK